MGLSISIKGMSVSALLLAAWDFLLLLVSRPLSVELGTGRCGGGRYGGGHYGGGRYGGGRYGGGRYGGAFQLRVDATAEQPNSHITVDATAGWG